MISVTRVTKNYGSGTAGYGPWTMSGMTFQHFNLLSSRTVQANVELSRGRGGTMRRRH